MPLPKPDKRLKTRSEAAISGRCGCGGVVERERGAGLTARAGKDAA